MVSIMDVKNAQIAVYSVPDEETLNSDVMQIYLPKFDAIIAYFDAEDRESFKVMQKLIGNTVQKIGRVLPLVLLGQAKYPGSPSIIPVHEILEYSYTLGEATCHQIPYRIISFIDSDQLKEIMTDLMKIIACSKKELCRSKSPLLRKWCEIDQYYSFITDSNIQLL